MQPTPIARGKSSLVRECDFDGDLLLSNIMSFRLLLRETCRLKSSEPAVQSDAILAPRWRAVRLICIFLVVVSANGWLDVHATEYFRSDARKAQYAGAAISFIVLLIAFLFRPLFEAVKARQRSVMILGSIESFRHVSPINVFLACGFGVSMAILAVSNADWKTKFLGLLAICLVPGVISESRKIPINLAFKGSYEKALKVQSWICFLPDCGEILNGWILIEAGRYEEARRVLANQAFDAKQRPLPFSFHLVLYVHALGAEGLLRLSKSLTAGVERPRLRQL